MGHTKRIAAAITLTLVTFTAGAVGTASTSTPAGDFRLVTPCRLADTRWTPGTPNAGDYQHPVQAGVDADYQSVRVGLGACRAVPVNAVAVAVNITVTHQGRAPGYVTAWSGVGVRPLASNMNLPRTRTTEYATAVVQLAGDGTFALYGSTWRWRIDDVDVIVDVVGWYR